jgi:hypothetical protein
MIMPSHLIISLLFMAIFNCNFIALADESEFRIKINSNSSHLKFFCANGNEPRVAMANLQSDPPNNQRTGGIFFILQQMWFQKLVSSPSTVIFLKPNILFLADDPFIYPDQPKPDGKPEGRADIKITIYNTGVVDAQIIRSSFDDTLNESLIQSIKALSLDRAISGKFDLIYRPKWLSFIAMFRNSASWPIPQYLNW